MNKKELVETVAKATDSSQAQAGAAVDAVVEAITSELKGGGSVTLPGFGTFEVRERSAREGRNPQTGETMQIAASKAPAFKAGAQLKRSVNG
jgi:DNA-binding protein HU-beta